MSNAFPKHGADNVGPWRSIIQKEIQVINADSNN